MQTHNIRELHAIATRSNTWNLEAMQQLPICSRKCARHAILTSPWSQLVDLRSFTMTTIFALAWKAGLDSGGFGAPDSLAHQGKFLELPCCTQPLIRPLRVAALACIVCHPCHDRMRRRWCECWAEWMLMRDVRLCSWWTATWRVPAG